MYQRYSNWSTVHFQTEVKKPGEKVDVFFISNPSNNINGMTLVQEIEDLVSLLAY